MTPSTDKPVAFITGAYRGLGLESARQLAAQGYRVILGMRDPAKGESALAELRASGADASIVTIDVTDDASVQAAAETITRDFGRLDVLINNAGVFLEMASNASALDGDLDVIMNTINLNALGALRTARAFHPLLKASETARIVNVSSEMGSLAGMQGMYPGYRLSKAAMNGVTRMLATELRRDKIKVNSVCPGWVKTEMGGQSAPRELPEGGASIVWAATLGDDGPTGGFFRDGQPIAW